MLKVDKLYDEIHKSWKYDDLLWRHKEIYADIQSFGYSSQDCTIQSEMCAEVL